MYLLRVCPPPPHSTFCPARNTYDHTSERNTQARHCASALRPQDSTQSNLKNPENSVPRFYNLLHLRTHPQYQSAEGGSCRHLRISFPFESGTRAQPEPPAYLPQGLCTCSDVCLEHSSSSVHGWAFLSFLAPSNTWSPVVLPSWHLLLLDINVFISLHVEFQSP